MAITRDDHFFKQLNGLDGKGMNRGEINVELLQSLVMFFALHVPEIASKSSVDGSVTSFPSA